MAQRIHLFTASLIVATAGVSSLSGQTAAGCAIFPANSVWNTPVDHLPVDANSAAYISAIGTGRRLHPDFSSSGGGIPYVVVPGSQPKVPISFGAGASESDPGPYPVPPNAPLEAGGDAHVIVLENTNCILYEMYGADPQSGGSWTASSGAIFNLKSNQLRPATWTSADAAGLPIFPGLVRYDEVASGVINHALRITAPHTRNQYIWPARHKASRLSGTQYPPMGQRFRLKASFDISPYPADVQVILTALKKYGAILADNGSAWYLTGTADSRWNDSTLHQLHLIFGSNLEAVNESSLMTDPDSGTVLAGPAGLQSVQLSPGSITAGAITTKNQVVLSAPAPMGGVTVILSSSNVGVASVPASVLVPAGSTTAVFTIQAGTVGGATSATITASYLGVSQTATLTVGAVGINSVTITPGSVTGGANASGVVTLTGAAPASGVTVVLASSNTRAATVPASLTIPAGATSGAFTISSVAQVASSNAQITASYGTSTAVATLTVTAPALSTAAPVPTSVVLSRSTIQGGNLVSGYIWLSADAPAGGLTLTVKSSNPLFTLTSSGWTVAAGSNMKYFVLTAPAVTSQAVGTISVTANGVTQSAVLTVNPSTIQGLTLSSTSVTGRSPVTATIFLAGVAPSGGTVVSVSSSSPALAATPRSVTVPAGNKTATFAIPTAAVATPAAVGITIRQGTNAFTAKVTIHP